MSHFEPSPTCPKGPEAQQLVGSFVLLVLTLSAQSFGWGATLTTEAEVLADAQSMRTAFQFDASSAYGQSANVTSVGGALLFLPVGLIYFLFAPFPWAITSILQAITVPEIMVWYLLVPFVWRGIRIAFGGDLRSYTTLMAVFVAVTFAYAMVEANIGTAYRHRAQILPIAFVFCALGLKNWYAEWSQRRAGRSKVRRRAHASMGGRPMVRPPFPPR